jgi:hypothetical protein
VCTGPKEDALEAELVRTQRQHGPVAEVLQAYRAVLPVRVRIRRRGVGSGERGGVLDFVGRGGRRRVA